jgi:hypothetical protein
MRIDSQGDLRRPLKEVDPLLAKQHQCDNNPMLTKAFLTNVAVLPVAMARIFAFMTVVSILDDVDRAYVDLSQAS